MSQSVDLSGPRTKLARASELRGELANHIQQTLEPVENRPSVALGVDNATKEHILYVDRVPDLPGFLPRVGILVGDIVHNMRSSLDHLVFQLALVNTAGKVVHPERTQFPICDTPQQYMRAAANNLSEVAQHDARIIQGFQPYCPMDENVSVGVYFHPLAMLRDLSNQDKHRSIAPVLIPSTGLDLRGPAESLALGLIVMDIARKMIQGSEPRAEAMVPGLVIARFPFTLEATSQLPQPAGFALPAVGFPDGRSVLAVLDKIGRAVDSVISAFDDLGEK